MRLLFADDLMLLAYSGQGLQRALDRQREAGTKVSAEKGEDFPGMCTVAGQQVHVP